MGIFQAVKQGFCKSFKLGGVIGIFLFFNLIIGLLSLPLTDPANAGNPVMLWASVGMSLIFFVIFVFLQGGAMGIVKDEMKTGVINLGKFLSYGAKYYLRILGLLLLYILIAIGVVLILALISAGVLLLGDNVFTRSIVAVIVTITAVVSITLLIYPIYTIVVDDMGPIAAFRRGILVAWRNFARTLGVFMLMLLISVGISLLIGFIAGLATVPMGEMGGRIVLAVVNAVVQSYIPLVMMISLMSFYMSLTSSLDEQKPCECCSEPKE
ncbi:membrane protein [Candidatus Omnitrophus magneticus]|uniref:Membrane protein n=1 Tax=Candidatus Omnitrophus magneticus TaxID=1609969 RepID=A0A0F0CM22_9BACT|nr:membrane protein [Candidatus Omnitrophus magneticus]